MNQKKPVVAFCYDFDGTLAPGYMQDHSFIPEIGMEKSDFWKEVKQIAKKQKGDQIHAYMHLMQRKGHGHGLKLNKKQWKERGKDLPLFCGVNDWFYRQNNNATELGLSLEHYIISSGVREIIEGSPISKYFKKIYASSFLYNADGSPDGVALSVNYTTKTQYLFRINKGCLDEWDDLRINKWVPEAKRRVPFNRMVFFGDGETDVPCMRLVSEQRGYAVAVHNPDDGRSREAATDLIAKGRAHFLAPGNYSADTKLDKIARGILEEIGARERLENLSGLGPE